MQLTKVIVNIKKVLYIQHWVIPPLNLKNSQCPWLSILRNYFWQINSYMYKDFKTLLWNIFLRVAYFQGIPEIWLKIDSNFGKT